MWGIANIDEPDVVIHGIDIHSYIEHIENQNRVIWFHNLKFDGTFLLDELLRRGYEHTDSKYRLAHGQFKTLISDMGMFYSITVCWETGFTTEFRDSYKKINMRVEEVAKAFGLPMSKGELDYEKVRPVGYQPNDEEIDYLNRDVSIMAHAMKTTSDAGMTKLTIGSDSLAEYKRIIGSKTFDRMFPRFGEHMDGEIRRAYRGGFTYADPRFVQQRTRSGFVLDVNSLYPSVMWDCVLPYGEPQFVNGRVTTTEDRPLAIFSVTFTAKLKPNHIPCIQIKGSNRFVATEYLRHIKEPVTLMCTNVDFDLWSDHYDIDVLAWNDGWLFKGSVGLFEDYISKWSEVKMTSTGGKREIAKMHLNTLYGKFATNPKVASKIPYLDEDRVKFETGPQEMRAPVYTAMGVFITAYARDKTIRAAQANYDVFAYADTDSLHLLTDELPADLDIHDTKMGSWALEYRFESAYFIRPKAYLQRKPDGTYKNAIAGLPVATTRKMTFDHVFDGAMISGKLRPKTVPGGVVLLPEEFRLKL